MDIFLAGAQVLFVPTTSTSDKEKEEEKTQFGQVGQNQTSVLEEIFQGNYLKGEIREMGIVGLENAFLTMTVCTTEYTIYTE